MLVWLQNWLEVVEQSKTVHVY